MLDDLADGQDTVMDAGKFRIAEVGRAGGAGLRPVPDCMIGSMPAPETNTCMPSNMPGRRPC